jgi:hypothetical protein
MEKNFEVFPFSMDIMMKNDGIGQRFFGDVMVKL